MTTPVASPITSGVRGALGSALDERALLESRDELRWLVPRIQGAAARIDAASTAGGQRNETAIAGKRAIAAGHDLTHDGAHRYVVTAFDLAILAENDAEQKRTVTIGRQALYPIGLDITQATYRAQGNETLLYKNRLSQPEVVSALTLVREHAPKVDAFIDVAVSAGIALATVVRELDVLEAASGETGEMFAARREGMQVLALLRDVVDRVLPESDESKRVERERIVGAYLRVLAEASEAATRATLRVPAGAPALPPTP